MIESHSRPIVVKAPVSLQVVLLVRVGDSLVPAFEVVEVPGSLRVLFFYFVFLFTSELSILGQIIVVVVMMVVVVGHGRMPWTKRAKARANHDGSCPRTIPEGELVAPDIVLTAIVLVIFQFGLCGFRHLT